MMMALGLSVLYSLFYNSPDIGIFYRQLIYIVLGLMLAFIVSNYDYRILRRLITLVVLISLG